jgi:short-subunit dehydrogenase
MRYLITIALIIQGFLVQAQENHDVMPSDQTNNLRSMRYAVVAGGSKGIGYAIAEALAKRGYHLVLIARHVDALEHAKSVLQKKYKVDIRILVFDLSKEESAEAIAKYCQDHDLNVNMLCNVAGLGGSDDYLSLSLDSLRYMVNLNVESCMALTLTMLPNLERHAPSYVMNVASMAGYAPIPDKNMYSATKSAVIFFSYALRYQLKEKNISVSCLTPGPVFTKESVRRETERQLGSFGKKMAVNPGRVGEIAVRKTLKGKMTITPGTLASINAAIIRTLPRRLVVALYHRVEKRSKQKDEAAIAEK